jgi:branched-chain amino acid aminotransferase
MIWHEGQIVPPDMVRVDLADRVFEHGLGLFETFRTWDRHAPLLSRHLDRLRSSARELGLGVDGVILPDDEAVATLLVAEQIGDDAMLRITMTGGTADGKRPALWMSARRMPEPDPGPVKIVTYDVPTSRADRLASHKSLNYWSRRLAHAFAESRGAVDCLIGDGEGRVWEGSRNNVLLVPEGRSDTIVTPGLDAPIVPGIMRRVALEFARGLGYRVEERSVDCRELFNAEAVFLTNSVRGVRRVGQIDGQVLGAALQAELTRSFVVNLPHSLRRGKASTG